MAPETGLEPVTRRLTAGCSTIELLWNPLTTGPAGLTLCPSTGRATGTRNVQTRFPSVKRFLPGVRRADSTLARLGPHAPHDGTRPTGLPLETHESVGPAPSPGDTRGQCQASGRAAAHSTERLDETQVGPGDTRWAVERPDDGTAAERLCLPDNRVSHVACGSLLPPVNGACYLGGTADLASVSRRSSFGPSSW